IRVDSLILKSDGGCVQAYNRVGSQVHQWVREYADCTCIRSRWTVSIIYVKGYLILPFTVKCMVKAVYHTCIFKRAGEFPSCIGCKRSIIGIECIALTHAYTDADLLKTGYVYSINMDLHSSCIEASYRRYAY